MALLSRWLPAARRARWIAGLALAGLAGCVLVGSLSDGPKPLAFSHKLHVGDQGLGCTDCHLKWNSAEDPGLPSAKQCALCHEEIDAQKPIERRIGVLFDGQNFKASRFSRQSSEIVFSHQKHAVRNEDCLPCHAALATNERVEPGLKLSMDTCRACHAEKHGPAQCKDCHSEIRSDVRPRNHGPVWKREHGSAFRAREHEDKQQRCDLCHQESSCSACHKSEPPANHNGFWRRRGHGLAASMDRKSCATCHEAESCEACHRETKPMNHSGSWGEPLARHCLTCHEPLRYEDNCQTCHKDTPSHQLAPPPPAWHIPAMNCRQCHGNGQPLPHVDNGDTCISCHY